MMPIIKPVMAADARGASRRGRYPTRSTIMPTKAVRNMEIKSVSTSSTQPGKTAAAPRTEKGQQPDRHAKPDVSAHHEDIPMGEVEQHEDAVHHGVPECDQGVKAAPLQGH